MSTSGVLARSIDISPELVIWVRCMIAAAALYIVLKVLKLPLWTGKGKALWIVAFSTIFFGIHWITYFYALHFSTVAIGMLSLFTYPVFTAILEPIITRSRLKPVDIILSIVAFSGVYFLVPTFDLTNQVTQGVILGILSAVAYSLRNIMLKLHVQEHSGITLMFMQVVGLSVFLSPFLVIGGLSLNLELISNHWIPILILGLFTTAIGHTLFVASFKNFSITVISILSTLTPLIGIFLGYFFLNEIPEGNVWVGGVLISIAVVVESFKTAKKSD